MMKKKLYKLCFLGLVMLSSTAMAQNYNKLYDFNADFNNSVHTAAVKTTNNNVVAGGTLAATGIFAGGDSRIEITVTDPATGNVISNTNYFRAGVDLELIDIIESDIVPNQVIVVANATNSATGKTVLLVFKTNPLFGGIIWVRNFMYPNPSNIYGSAITSDDAGNYFILSEREASSTVPGIIKIDDAGNDIWKVLIRTKNHEFKGADLICVGNKVIATGDLSTGVGVTGGMLIAEIDATTGGLVSSTKVESLDGDTDLKVDDIDLLGGVSSVVGNSSSTGFVLKFDALLAPSLGKGYTSNTGESLKFTGISQANLFNSYVSFDYSPLGDNHPGVVQINGMGSPLSSVIFDVNNYKESIGLINLNGNYLIKGSTQLNLLNPAKMSFTATQTPLVGNNNNCSEALVVSAKDLTVVTGDIKARCEYDETISVSANGTPNYTSIQVIETSCPVPGAMKNASTGEIENQLETSFTVYPNPSSGWITLELNQESLTEINQVDVFNSLGELVLSVEVKNSRTHIDLSELSGLYFLSTKRKDGTIAETKRVSIQ